MGIDLPAFEFLLRARQQTGPFGKTLTLGRQRMLINDNTRPNFARVLAKYRPDLSIADVERHTHVDALIECLGGEPHYMDNSAYEGAQVIHDLNEPLARELAGTYDTVIDIGTLEHVFNIGQGMRNVAQIVKPGGHFLSLQVANHHLGHGFWQFGPEAFFRTFDDDNGYQPLICDLYYGGAFHEVRDPEQAGMRLPIQTPGYTYIVFAAKRVAERTIFGSGWPAQADYLAAWKIFLARRARDAGDLADAERQLRDAIAAHPRNPLYLAELSRLVRSDRARLAEADELTRRAVEMVSDNPVINREREAVVAALGAGAAAATRGSAALPATAASAAPARSTGRHVVADVARKPEPPLIETGVIEIGGIKVAYDDPRVPEATRGALTNGRYEFKERELCRRLIQPADRVIELGTGMGVVSLTIAARIGAEAVLSFEANPTIFELARENAARNGLELQMRNAIASPRATTAPGSTIEFFAMKSFEASSTRRVSPGQVPVQIPAEILEDHIGQHRANALVMDIEGFESEIIRNADLSGIDKLVLEMHPKVIGVDGVVDLVTTLEDQGLVVRRDLLFGDVMAFDKAAERVRDTREVVEAVVRLEAAWLAGDLVAARKHVHELEGRIEENAYFQHRRSQVMRRHGESGLQYAEAASRLGSGDPGLFADLTNMYCNAGRYRDAEWALGKLREVFPRSGDLQRLANRVERGLANGDATR